MCILGSEGNVGTLYGETRRYCEDGSTTGALEYDGFQHAVMMPCSWVDPNGDVTDRRNTVCRRTIPNGIQTETEFGLFEVRF
jgi:hypothetical protein